MDEKKKRLVLTVVAISFVLQLIVLAYLFYDVWFP
jgi:hypothetical protein